MSHPARIGTPVFVSLTLACLAAAWWGCSAPPEQQTSLGASASASSSGGTGGAESTGATGGTGGVTGDFDGGGAGDGGVCVSTSAAAEHVPLDIIFLIDQSGSMHGLKWMTVTSALTTFFNDPASNGIGAGMLFFPYSAWDCDLDHYKTLTVPTDVLPANAFALTNSFVPDAMGAGTPTYPALEGTLMQATAYQDAHPTHKVIVILATDGDPNGCDNSIPDIAGLASSALNYDGVHTYVIGVPGATIANLDQIALAGGTMSAYDNTNDITLFFSTISQIRTVGLGCDFEIPPPPDTEQLNPDEVNFSYTPKGTGMPAVLPRATDLAGCNGQPGWYYDNNTAPTEITLCPASCATVQADSSAKVSVLFGCKSVLN